MQMHPRVPPAPCINSPHTNLHKLCATVYPEFQASPSYEHLCEELTTGARSSARARQPASPPYSLSNSPTTNVDANGVFYLDDGGGGDDGIGGDCSATASAGGYSRLSMTPSPQEKQQHRLRQEERSPSPFSLLSSSPEKRGNSKNDDSDSGNHLRRSIDPSIGSGSVGGSGSVNGRSGTGGSERSSWSAGGQIDSSVVEMFGPQFGVLWEASRGWVLDKVMRKMELPSHISRHRPPLRGRGSDEDGARGGGEGGSGGERVRRLSRSGSGAGLGSGEDGEGRMGHILLYELSCLEYVYVGGNRPARVFFECSILCNLFLYVVLQAK